MRRLFERSKVGGTLFDKTLDSRLRKSRLAAVTDHLNDTLTKEWARFRLDGSNSLRVEISYDEPTGSTNPGSVRVEIVDKTPAGNKYFYIANRSKGFYWFFNFVMKLEFNDKASDGHSGQSVIHLLDEPGSYVHASAQKELCEKLKALSGEHAVVYCTHSHYLLDPTVIPFKSIHIAEKDEAGSVTLYPVGTHRTKLSHQKLGAFQPVLDALQAPRYDLDNTTARVLVVEGITDFHAFKLFLGASIGVLPATTSDSICYHIPGLIMADKDFAVLWDNDPAGRRSLDQASSFLDPAWP